jgi:hypothetical protein
MGRTLAGLYSIPDSNISLHCVGWIKSPLSAAVEVDGLRLGIELSDHADLWDEELLEWSDVYAKRNLNEMHGSTAPHKIIPFGVNWACHSRTSLLAILKELAGSLPSLTQSRCREIYRYLVTPHWKHFEHRPDQPVESAILFQTRVWPPEDAPGDELVNEQRVGLLRALKREFGDRVQGGIVPTPYALRYYKELVTAGPSRQSQYIRWAKKPLIGIYSRGLFGSVAFKLAEFLAASKCIVSEPIGNQLSAPLEHLSIYRSEDECLTACEMLLSNKSLADFHRDQSWSYYTRCVQPRAHMLDLLSRARAQKQ